MGQKREVQEEIVIIGGGLGGCLTALMLAKNPKFHITIIEEKESLLSGASLAAAQLHLGNEYPLNEKTALDCLNSAVIWKLLMPDDIYTQVPPKMFLVDKNTQNFADNNPGLDTILTTDIQYAACEKIRLKYEELFKKVMAAKGWDEADTTARLRIEEVTAQQLFGSYKEGEFFRSLQPEEYADYTNIAGGIQTQEIGLNVPKYLAKIQAEIERLEKAGRIKVLTGHKVSKDGVEGELGSFTIHCKEIAKNTDRSMHVEASQVVQAAWQGGMEISPETGKKITVYQRGMLAVDLSRDKPLVPPAFIMKDQNGGMFSPFNDKVALAYITASLAVHFTITPIAES